MAHLDAVLGGKHSHNYRRSVDQVVTGSYGLHTRPSIALHNKVHVVSERIAQSRLKQTANQLAVHIVVMDQFVQVQFVFRREIMLVASLRLVDASVCHTNHAFPPAEALDQKAVSVRPMSAFRLGPAASPMEPASVL